MATATVRDLRTRFPHIRHLLEQEGEIVVTDHGSPVAILRPFKGRKNATSVALDYYARLRRRMPKPITMAARRALDEVDRDER